MYEAKSPEAVQIPADVTHVAFGERSGAFTDASGNVWAWGRSLGRDVGAAQLVLKGKRAVKVACGDETTYALTKGGRVFSWRNDAPQSVSEVMFLSTRIRDLRCVLMEMGDDSCLGCETLGQDLGAAFRPCP